MAEPIILNRKRKLCPLDGGCGKQKKLKQFSVSKSRPDGRCVYCSDCTKRIAQTYRDRLKATIGRTSLNPRSYVSVSIKREFEGAQLTKTVENILQSSPRTREEIIALTDSNEDSISDILATLYGKGAVRIDRVTRTFQLVNLGAKRQESCFSVLNQAAA